MLAELTPQQFDELLAFDRLEPIDELERLCRLMRNGFALLANAWGVEVDAEAIDELRPEDEQGEPKQDWMSPRAVEATLQTLIARGG